MKNIVNYLLALVVMLVGYYIVKITDAFQLAVIAILAFIAYTLADIARELEGKKS